MTVLTEKEWEGVQSALVRGGLRQCIDRLLISRAADRPTLNLSTENLAMIFEAYDDGDDNNIVLIPSTDGYFAGMWEDQEVMLGTQIEGMLYCIAHLSGGGRVAVHVDDQIITSSGEVFNSVAEAKAYIKGLTTR